jgi:predicted DNA-binding protein
VFAISLPHDVEIRYRTLARTTGKSIEEYLKEAAEKYLDALDEDRQDAEDSLTIRERLAAWEQQGCPGITLEEYAHSRGLGHVE